MTFEITAAGLAGSLAVGILGAALRTSRSRPARALATAFTEFFRNTPPLVHIFFAYFALPAIGINVPGIVAAPTALILYQGAIAIEIIRAGLEAVPPDSWRLRTRSAWADWIAFAAWSCRKRCASAFRRWATT